MILIRIVSLRVIFSLVRSIIAGRPVRSAPFEAEIDRLAGWQVASIITGQRNGDEICNGNLWISFSSSLIFSFAR